MSKYYELINCFVRVAPDCVLPIKNLERALMNSYTEFGGPLQCSPDSNPRHESEDLGTLVRMLMANVWSIANTTDALRRVLTKATIKESQDIRDLLRSLREARTEAGLPNVTAASPGSPDPAPLAIADQSSPLPLRRAASAPLLALLPASPPVARISRSIPVPPRTPIRSATGRRSVTPSPSPSPSVPTPVYGRAAGSPQLAWAFGCTTTTTKAKVVEHSLSFQ